LHISLYDLACFGYGYSETHVDRSGTCAAVGRILTGTWYEPPDRMIARIVGIALLVGLVACTTEVAVRRTFELRADPPMETRSWADIGIVQVDHDGDVVIGAFLSPEPRRLGVNGLADRDSNTILIADHLVGFQLAVVIAHEVGHVVLDTGEHTSCGVMGSIDVVLCAADRELAERRLDEMEAVGFDIDR